MYKMNVEALKGALKKLKGFVGETVTLVFMEKEAKGEDARYLKITASNGTAQATVLAAYVGDNTEERKYIVSSSFMEAVETISAFGEDVELEELDGCLKLTCGDAVVPVGLLKDAVTLTMHKNSEKLQMKLKADDFCDIVSHGGFATGDATVPVPVFRGTVIFEPFEDKDKIYLRAMSCCGVFLATASAEVEVKQMDVFKKYIEENRRVAVNYASLLALSKRFVGDVVNIVITEKQLIVMDSVDVYLFTIIDGKVPKPIVDAVCGEAVRTFSYSLDKETLKKALTVIALTGDKYARLCFDKEVLVIEDSNHTSRASVPLTAIREEKAEFKFDAGALKNIASALPSELIVYGAEGANGLHFEGKNCKALIAPISEE